MSEQKTQSFVTIPVAQFPGKLSDVICQLKAILRLSPLSDLKKGLSPAQYVLVLKAIVEGKPLDSSLRLTADMLEHAKDVNESLTFPVIYKGCVSEAYNALTPTEIRDAYLKMLVAEIQESEPSYRPPRLKSLEIPEALTNVLRQKRLIAPGEEPTFKLLQEAVDACAMVLYSYRKEQFRWEKMDAKILPFVPYAQEILRNKDADPVLYHLVTCRFNDLIGRIKDGTNLEFSVDKLKIILGEKNDAKDAQQREQIFANFVAPWSEDNTAGAMSDFSERFRGGKPNIQLRASPASVAHAYDMRRTFRVQNHVVELAQLAHALGQAFRNGQERGVIRLLEARAPIGRRGKEGRFPLGRERKGLVPHDGGHVTPQELEEWRKIYEVRKPDAKQSPEADRPLAVQPHPGIKYLPDYGERSSGIECDSNQGGRYHHTIIFGRGAFLGVNPQRNASNQDEKENHGQAALMPEFPVSYDPWAEQNHKPIPVSRPNPRKGKEEKDLPALPATPLRSPHPQDEKPQKRDPNGDVAPAFGYVPPPAYAPGSGPDGRAMKGDVASSAPPKAQPKHPQVSAAIRGDAASSVVKLKREESIWNNTTVVKGQIHLHFNTYKEANDFLLRYRNNGEARGIDKSIQLAGKELIITILNSTVLQKLFDLIPQADQGKVRHTMQYCKTRADQTDSYLRKCFTTQIYQKANKVASALKYIAKCVHSNQHRANYNDDEITALTEKRSFCFFSWRKNLADAVHKDNPEVFQAFERRGPR